MDCFRRLPLLPPNTEYLNWALFRSSGHFAELAELIVIALRAFSAPAAARLQIFRCPRYATPHTSTRNGSIAHYCALIKMRRWSTSLKWRWFGAWLVSILHLTRPASLSTSSVEVTVTSGQQLADAVAEFGASRQDVVVNLQPLLAQNGTYLRPGTVPPTISLATANFTPTAMIAAMSTARGGSGLAFGSGRLLIQGTAAEPADSVHSAMRTLFGAAGGVVLDAAGRHDLTPQFTATTTLALQGFSMVRGRLVRASRVECDVRAKPFRHRACAIPPHLTRRSICATRRCCGTLHWALAM
jgi:hypothetical protein